MIIGLIPSRLNSKRLKNKPLLKIDGLPIVVHTFKRAKLSKKEQDVIYSAIETFTGLILAREKLEINRRNLNLLVRQVETDKVRLDRGKITITDLSQSESSLAGAQAQFTQASNDLLISILNYENIVGNSPDPNKLKKNSKAIANIPSSLENAIELSKKK